MKDHKQSTAELKRKFIELSHSFVQEVDGGTPVTNLQHVQIALDKLLQEINRLEKYEGN